MELRQILALSFSLALISFKGQELELWHDFKVCPMQNPPVLPHRYVAEINSIALRVAEEFTLLGGCDLWYPCLEKKLLSM